MKRATQIVKKELERVESLLEAGKGEWPNNDYVKDSIWDGWLGQRYALSKILKQLEAANDTP
jgi:hypothetical protein